MMFRKLYWVTESLDSKGRSKVTGVYTSIPDLLRYGIAHQEKAFRLTLTKLDSDHDPLGSWSSPEFDGLADALKEFVRTEEFSEEHCNDLICAVGKRVAFAA